jgi:TatD DNase family protein
MLIDTHCHLAGDYGLSDDLDAVVARATNAGVTTLVCPTAEPGDIPAAVALAGRYGNIFATVGVHPERAKSNIDIGALLPDSLFDNPKVVGVGEIGLDYHYGAEFKNRQIELFEKQLEIARRALLPVAIHTREAEEDTAAILDGSVGGVMHCYASSWGLAKTMLNRGFFFSASGIITFKNSGELRETFAKIPTDRIVIETDSPYCAPVPYRGQKCEPFMATEVAKVLAQIKNLQLEELAAILSENTKKLYPRIKL